MATRNQNDYLFEYVSLSVAADIIGITAGRLRQMILADEIKDRTRHGATWLIGRSEVEKIRNTKHAAGRPRRGISKNPKKRD